MGKCTYYASKIIKFLPFLLKTAITAFIKLYNN